MATRVDDDGGLPSETRVDDDGSLQTIGLIDGLSILFGRSGQIATKQASRVGRPMCTHWLEPMLYHWLEPMPYPLA